MRSIRFSVRLGEAAPVADAIRATPLGDMIGVAEAITDSEPVISVFAACEFNELNEDGRLWVAAIVRESMAWAAEARL